jgi:hypothetical protein
MKAQRRIVTAVRSGVAVRSYGHAIEADNQGVTLTAGAIKPGPDGEVPLHVRVQEGYDAKGNKVDKFVIKAKNDRVIKRRLHFGHTTIGANTPNPYFLFTSVSHTVRLLTFPIRKGPGLAKGNIVGWVSKEEISLKPRPVVESVGQQIPDALRAVCGKVFVDALRAT